LLAVVVFVVAAVVVVVFVVAALNVSYGKKVGRLLFSQQSCRYAFVYFCLIKIHSFFWRKMMKRFI